MKKLIPALFLTLLLVSCNGGVSKEEYDALLKENKQLKEQVEELQNTPTNLLVLGRELLANNKSDSAKIVLKKLITKYPSSAEAEEANKIVTKVEKEEKEAREKAEKEAREKAEQEARKKAMGFKILKESSSISYGDITVNFKSVSIGKRWIFDAYDDEWFYRDAERDKMYVLARISITSKSKSPMLPPIGIYRYKDGKLFLVSEMGYKFARWKSYGHYLGNYADYSNDFAHTSTIPFSNAAEIKKDDQNDVLFVVMRKKGCFERVDLGFSNPEVGYASSGSNMATILSVDDFDSEYSLVKVFNKNKM